jgi:hypothetical protein
LAGSKIQDGGAARLVATAKARPSVFISSLARGATARDCLTIQFEYPDKPGEKHVIFTGSNVLIDQLKQYGEKLPFLATIRKKDRYYTLS